MINRNLIRERAGTLGMSLRALALAAGWSEDQAPRIERVISGDTADPGFSTAEGIADGLGITMDELRTERPRHAEARSVILEALRLANPDQIEILKGIAADIVATARTNNPPIVPARRGVGRPPGSRNRPRPAPDVAAHVREQIQDADAARNSAEETAAEAAGVPAIPSPA